MSIEYDAFRNLSWSQRLEIFSALSPDAKAELVRKHIALWLEKHQDELSAEQIEIVRENIAFIRAELYVLPKPQHLLDEAMQLEIRTAAVLSREQMRQALTMHW